MVLTIQTILSITERARLLQETDPHGWILTTVSVLMVFSVLIVLFVIYALVGEYFMGTFHRIASRLRSKFCRRAAEPEDSRDESERVAAAIGTALELYNRGRNQEVPGITILPQEGKWKDKTLNFRKTPIRP